MPQSAPERALLARVRAIPEGEVSETARRCGLTVRALQLIRAGRANVTLATLARPRSMRREDLAGEPYHYEEDAPDGREEV